MKVRDFDQFFGSLRSMMEIAKNQASAIAARICELFVLFVSQKRWPYEEPDDKAWDTGIGSDTRPRSRHTDDHSASHSARVERTSPIRIRKARNVGRQPGTECGH